MKTTKLVHSSHARCVDSEVEASRLRRMGWIEVPEPKAIGRNASAQRKFREQCREMGLRQLLVWLPRETYSALVNAKSPGESLAELIQRLVDLQNGGNKPPISTDNI